MGTSFNLVRAKAPESFKVLFVDVNEEDTSFLTKDVPIDVVHVSSAGGAEAHLERNRFDALVMGVSGYESEGIRKFKESHDTAVFLLADRDELSKAIEFVKQGADGFLLRGVSNPASFVKLTKTANHCKSSN